MEEAKEAEQQLIPEAYEKLSAFFPAKKNTNGYGLDRGDKKYVARQLKGRGAECIF